LDTLWYFKYIAIAMAHKLLCFPMQNAGFSEVRYVSLPELLGLETWRRSLLGDDARPATSGLQSAEMVKVT
jgi:hypothetical protein